MQSANIERLKAQVSAIVGLGYRNRNR